MNGLIGGLAGARLRIQIRIELMSPVSVFLLESFYNIVVTRHAFLIIFFIVIPILIGAFGN
jgi:cytochrome c oxidase subunit 1